MEGPAWGGEALELLLRWESGKARLGVEERSRAGGFEVLRLGVNYGDKYVHFFD